MIFPESSAIGNTKYIQATVPATEVNSDVFDVGFTAAIGCALYKGSAGCRQMKNDLRFADAVQLTDHWNYKYLIDIDGMGYSAHFLAFMASQSAVLKSTVYREFFSDWIQPWYVAIQRTDPILPYISNWVSILSSARTGFTIFPSRSRITISITYMPTSQVHPRWH